jgi:hypothetical protein
VPGNAPVSSRYPASVVHVAATFLRHAPDVAELDMDSLQRAGHAHLVPGWRAAVAPA